MINSQPLAIVIRIPNVTATQVDLEAILKCRLARYERSSTSGYAQLDIPETSDQWSEATKLIQTISEPIEKLVSERMVGRPSLDIAVRFPDGSFSASASIPASLAAAAGCAGMDIELSLYRTEDAVRPPSRL